MSILTQIKEAIFAGNVTDVRVLTNQALAEGLPAEEIVRRGYIIGMDKVGEGFKRNELYVPEMLIAAKAMKEGLKMLEPLIAQEQIQHQGTVVMGTVKGDLHDIGKNLVGMMLEGAGFKVIDLGIDVPPGRFAEAVRQHQPQFIGLSALLTTTMPAMETTIKLLEREGLRNQVKVIVGGAPINSGWAVSIGADGYAEDAGRAVDLARSLQQ